MSESILFEEMLPPFDTIMPEKVAQTIPRMLDENLSQINSLLKKTERKFDSFVLPLESLEDRLSRNWSAVSHLNSVKSTEALRKAYEGCLPKLSAYSTAVGHNKALYEAFLSLQDAPEFSSMTNAQQALITHAIRDFKLSGVALEGADKARYAELTEALSTLANNFSNHVMDATDQWHEDILDESKLLGLPEAIKIAAAEKAKSANVKGWRLGLDFPTYQAIVTYAEDRALRERFYRAYVTRASHFSEDKALDNTKVIEQLLEKRQALANLLGFENYAEYALATRMAKSVEEIESFYNELIPKAKPAAERELKALRDFAKAEGASYALEPWDMSYWSERYSQSHFSISQEALRAYFPIEKVLSGLFEITHRLYGVRVKEVPGKHLWHEQVRFFEIKDEAEQVIAQFFWDPYARAQKRSGAWMDECVCRFFSKDKQQVPVAHLVTNFRPPLADAQAQLTHDEVVTLFHEFGHGLHHMLTRVDYPSVSGINGVPWDAVELPSQFFENWCWKKESLDLISGHIETGEPLPADMVDQLNNAKKFGAGMAMMRQVEFGLFDLSIHKQSKVPDVQAVMDSIRQKTSVMQTIPENRFQNSFSHIFAGGYAAGYYSYLWAEVLAADAFGAFEETSIFDKETGRRFRDCILSKGGSEDPANLFKDFRKRAPSIDPLLKQSGLI